MRAFIVRPFGTKQGFNFDAVERDLIGPALDQAHIEGRTTGEILESGNIRVDMFQQLLVADLVVADITIHNANVFYELGIRHGLRDKRTYLIRASAGADETPFDLRTDRYLSYDPANPAASLGALSEALRQTLASERTDSPVFFSLPNLEVQDRSKFLPVPREFREELERAAGAEPPELGKIALLGEEAAGFAWETEGFRMVGRTQFNLDAHAQARSTWEALRKIEPADPEACLKLGSIYQTLRDYVRSQQSLTRVLNNPQATVEHRAEAHSLLGSSLKRRWRQSWSELPTEKQRAEALRSPLLTDAFEHYVTAYEMDLNHFYAGLNALALLLIGRELRNEYPDAYKDRFASDEEEAAITAQLEAYFSKLSGAVDLSLAAAAKRETASGEQKVWQEISRADFHCLTSKRSGYVRHLYQDALADAQDFQVESARRQLELLACLGVMKANVSAALEAFPSKPAVEPPERVVLFTGHRIDKPDRNPPRFPKEKAPLAFEKILEALSEEKKLSGGGLKGIAGAASGGDILFHEACRRLGIPSEVYLALPQDQYLMRSVADSGPEWVERFNDLMDLFPDPPVLAESEDLPGWLAGRKAYNIWRRNNLWMLHEALAAGAKQVTIIALWNRAAGDGAGGTEDMLRIAEEAGAKPIILDTNEIFGLKS